MEHFTVKSFWERYNALTVNVQLAADENFRLLKNDPLHPSLHFKKVGEFWSVRVNSDYRALAYEQGSDYVWFWIGRHNEYTRILRR